MENTFSEGNEDFIDVVTQDSSLSEQLSESTSDQLFQKDSDINEVSDDPNFQPPKINYDSIGEFCFESDDLALKGNPDYKNLLEAIVVLEAQRTKAVKDLEQLQKLKDEALADPFEFLERMRRKEDLQFPVAQKIHPVPTVDWGKYAVSGNPLAFERQQISQQKQQLQEFYRNSNKKAKLQVANNEQKTDLGDKLGILPDLYILKKKWNVSRKEENHSHNQESILKAKATQIEISDDEDISSDFQDSPEYKELILLKKALREKVVEESSCTTQHVGYKCCRCKIEPIVGSRWHCIDCKPPLSIDFCEDCTGCVYETRQHTADHQLEKQAANKGFLDRDYMHFMGSDYNYLDPNYMPAT